MNDKCAAGTGRFLELMARTLELTLEEMSTMGLTLERGRDHLQHVHGVCRVGGGFPDRAGQNRAADIIHGLNESVAAKTCRPGQARGRRRPPI